jgi:hypothetical protein
VFETREDMVKCELIWNQCETIRYWKKRNPKSVRYNDARDKEAFINWGRRQIELKRRPSDVQSFRMVYKDMVNTVDICVTVFSYSDAI